MRIKRLQLSGHFVEAFLYFDYAWLFSKDGVVRAFDLSKYCEERLNGESGAAMALFSDNRRLKIEQGTGANEPTALARLMASDAPIQVPVQDVDGYSHIFRTAVTCRSILDVRFYNGRAFVGTDDGMSQFVALGREDLRDTPLGRSNTGLSDQRVSDRPARQIQGRYGAVTAACGPDGGIVGVGVGAERRDRRVVFEQFAERSYAVEMNGNAVSSLATSTRVELYAVDSRKGAERVVMADRDDAPDRSVVVGITGRGFNAVDAGLNHLIDEVVGATRTFLFKDTLWVLAQDRIHRFKLADKDAVVDPRPSGTMVKPPARVLSTSTSKAGVLVESDDEVFLLNGGRWRVLVAEPVYSVRGYPTSKRYRHLVTSVCQDRVELAALL